MSGDWPTPCSGRPGSGHLSECQVAMGNKAIMCWAWTPSKQAQPRCKSQQDCRLNGPVFTLPLGGWEGPSWELRRNWSRSDHSRW